MRLNDPVTLMSIWKSQFSGVSFARARSTTLTPALLTRISMRPRSAMTPSTTSFTRGLSVTSAAKQWAAGPMLSQTAFSLTSSLPMTTTRAPSRAQTRAMAAPTPEPPPVMSTTFSDSFIQATLSMLARSSEALSRLAASRSLATMRCSVERARSSPVAAISKASWSRLS